MIEKLGYVIKRKYKSQMNHQPDEKSTVSHTQSENKIGSILQIRQQSRETQRQLENKVRKLNFLSNQTINSFQKMNELQNALFKSQNNKQFRYKSNEMLSFLKEKELKEQDEREKKIQLLKEQYKESMQMIKQRKEAWLSQVKEINKQNKNFYKSLINETQQIQLQENQEFCKQIKSVKRISSFHLEKKQRQKMLQFKDKKNEIHASLSQIQFNLVQKRKEIDFFQSKLQSGIYSDQETENYQQTQKHIVNSQLKTEKNNSVNLSPVQSPQSYYQRQKPF